MIDLYYDGWNLPLRPPVIQMRRYYLDLKDVGSPKDKVGQQVVTLSSW